MRFNNESKVRLSIKKKKEFKQYDSLYWVKQNLLFGLMIFIVCLIIYGIYKLVEWI
jgi:hypothetical protein